MCNGDIYEFAILVNSNDPHSLLFCMQHCTICNSIHNIFSMLPYRFPLNLHYTFTAYGYTFFAFNSEFLHREFGSWAVSRLWLMQSWQLSSLSRVSLLNLSIRPLNYDTLLVIFKFLHVIYSTSRKVRLTSDLK